MSIANAKPVYLECKTSPENKDGIFSVTLDESSGTIMTTLNKFSFKSSGFFKPDTVEYQRKVSLGVGIMIIEQYVINRIDLSFTKTSKASSKYKGLSKSEKPKIYKGKCKILKVKNRAF